MFASLATLLVLAALSLTLPAPTACHKLIAGKVTPTRGDTLFGGPNATILRFPADYNRDAFPKNLHSHNDYLRAVPIYAALASGARSVESDVWLHPTDGQLYVGHDPFSLSRQRTFSALTVEPLLAVLSQANEANAAQSNSSDAAFFAPLQRSVQTAASPAWNGYFSLGVGSTAPIQLLVDVKTRGNDTWPAVVRALEPLRRRGFLTRYEAGRIVPGPLLVIGTGNTPVEQIAPLPMRDVFFDGPLGNLSARLEVEGREYEWNSTLAPLASGSFVRLVGDYDGVDEASEEVRANVSRQVSEAHARGIEVRYWDSPQWPVFARDRVNAMLLSEGADWIGTDDLEAAAKW